MNGLNDFVDDDVDVTDVPCVTEECYPDVFVSLLRVQDLLSYPDGDFLQAWLTARL